MAMDPDDRGIDHRVFHVGLIGNGIEHALEHVGLYPIAEALEDCVPLAKRRWEVTPWTAGSRNPQHRLREQSRIPSRPARIGRLAQAEGLHLLPLRVCQAEPVHAKLLSELESRTPWSRESPNSQHALVGFEPRSTRRAIARRENLLMAMPNVVVIKTLHSPSNQRFLCEDQKLFHPSL